MDAESVLDNDIMIEVKFDECISKSVICITKMVAIHEAFWGLTGRKTMAIEYIVHLYNKNQIWELVVIVLLSFVVI